MDCLEAIFARASSGRLQDPAPNAEEMRTILRAAAAAPDHLRLRPLRLIVLEGSAKAEFGHVLAGALAARRGADGLTVEASAMERERTKLGRAPMVVVVAAADTTGGRIPFVEQQMAAAAAAENAILAATALGFGSMWRTGDPAYDPAVKAALGLGSCDAIVAFLYLGTPMPPPLDQAVERAPGQGPGPDPDGPDPDGPGLPGPGLAGPALDGIVTRWSPGRAPAMRYDQRPIDATPVHTSELPGTPQRDRNIPAVAWIEAPATLLRLGDDIGRSADITYKRRIGRWLLWRAGPAAGGDARYLAVAADDLGESWTFRLYADGAGEGTGPSGDHHHRFRSWKEDLRDHP